MKLPSLPLKRDPKAALAKAQFELTAAEATLSELAMVRGQALVDSDDVASVASIDQQLADQHRTISILTDRCTALARQVWEQDHARLEAERTAAIARLSAGFEKRRKLALELEAAVEKLGATWAALLEPTRAGTGRMAGNVSASAGRSASQPTDGEGIELGDVCLRGNSLWRLQIA